MTDKVSVCVKDRSDILFDLQKDIAISLTKTSLGNAQKQKMPTQKAGILLYFYTTD